jgi:hypothetical protein
MRCSVGRRARHYFFFDFRLLSVTSMYSSGHSSTLSYVSASFVIYMFEREKRTERRARYLSSIEGLLSQRHGSSIVFLAIAIVIVQFNGAGTAVLSED